MKNKYSSVILSTYKGFEGFFLCQTYILVEKNFGRFVLIIENRSIQAKIYLKSYNKLPYKKYYIIAFYFLTFMFVKTDHWINL